VNAQKRVMPAVAGTDALQVVFGAGIVTWELTTVQFVQVITPGCWVE
jgi:hypothetical protein